MDDVTVFQTLKRPDLQEKVDLNLAKGMTHQELKYRLLEERHDFQRAILRQRVQVQNLTEQIEYLNYLIEGGATNGG